MNISKVDYNFNYGTNYSKSNSIVRENPVPPKNTEPAVDTVSFKAKAKDVYKSYSCKDADMLKYDLDYSKPSFFKGKYEINGDEVELEVKNKFGGAQNIKGEAFGANVDVDIDSGFFGVRKGEVTGIIGDKPVKFKYQANENAKSIKISGEFEHLDDKSRALAIMLITDKLKYDIRAEQEMEMVAISTVMR